MRAQTRIFSVATTIACFALTSPGFAQAYVGGSGQPAVQVDFGALDALPGPAQGNANPAHHRGKKINASATSTAQTGGYETTIIGGGGDALAPVTILYTGRHNKAAPHKAKPVLSANELNAMQLASQKTILPDTTHTIASAATSPAVSLDNAQSLTSNPGAPSQPFDRLPAPPALPEEDRIAGLPPARDDYDERRKNQPGNPSEPFLPPSGPAPEGTNRSQNTAFIAPNTTYTTEALNRAELNRILVQNGMQPLPALAPMAAEAKPVKKRKVSKPARSPSVKAPSKTANSGQPKRAKTPVRTAQATQASAEATQPPSRPPSKKKSTVRSSRAAKKPVSAETSKRQEEANLSSTAYQTNPSPLAETQPGLPPVQQTASIAPQPATATTVLPSPTKIPASTPEDLIDESAQPYQPHTRIITDSNSPQAPMATPANYSVGYYDIPSTIPLNGNAQPAPVIKVPAPTQQPAFATLPAAPQTQPDVQSVEPTTLDQTPIVTTPLPQPLPAPDSSAPSKAPAETVPAATTTSTQAMILDQPLSLLPVAPPVTAPAPKLITMPAQPLVKTQDTTQNLNQNELAGIGKSVTSMPLDQPLAIATAPAPVVEKTAVLPPPPDSKPAPAPIVPTAVSSPAMKPRSNNDLSVTFTPGSVSLSQETNARLDELVGHLKQNPDLRVELRSLASASKESTSKARRTSLERALAIKSYLQSQGIAEDHIDVRALGAPPGQAPTDRVDFFLMR